MSRACEYCEDIHDSRVACPGYARHKDCKMCKALKAELEQLFAHCNIVFYPADGGYPIEHNMAANKDSRSLIEAALCHKEVTDA